MTDMRVVIPLGKNMPNEYLMLIPPPFEKIEEDTVIYTEGDSERPLKGWLELHYKLSTWQLIDASGISKDAHYLLDRVREL